MSLIVSITSKSLHNGMYVKGISASSDAKDTDSGGITGEGLLMPH